MPVPTSFHAAIDEQAALTPSVVAAVCCGAKRQVLTYEAIRARSVELAAGLKHAIASLPSCRPACEAALVIAIQLPRVHEDFVPLMVAASRAQLPFVLLSTDLPDRTLQQQRSRYAIQILQPALLIVSSVEAKAQDALCSESGISAKVLAVTELARERKLEIAGTDRNCLDPLCFLFTGGTQRTKVVQVTHAMLLHERNKYHKVAQPRSFPVILAHTSVYWGATALGQMSIAMAYRGTAVWTEASEAVELRRCIETESVTMLGLVPDQLDLLAPENPKHELPSVEIVFTWGERLPHRVAGRWRGHPTAVVRELLIASEYWLAFWADPLGDSVLRPVEGVDVLIIKECGEAAGVGELGELCLAGPMVMMGYVESAASSECFIVAGPAGKRFYRTRDLVRRTAEGFMYKGRADMMAKNKGKWVDMLDVEERISKSPGVLDAKILADPAQEHYHAFVRIGPSSSVGAVLSGIRVELPPRVQLWTVPELPRHPVTRKVDSARLMKIIGTNIPSWPIEGVPSNVVAPADLHSRLWRKANLDYAYTLVAFGIIWALSYSGTLLPQLVAAAVFFGTVAVMNAMDDERLCGTYACIGIWLFWCVFSDPLNGLHFVHGMWNVLLATYCWHALIYADDARSRSRLAKTVMIFVDECPLWKAGAIVTMMLFQHLWHPFGTLCHMVYLIVAGFGFVLAVLRGRVVAWPIVVWTLGAGHQLQKDCNGWMYFQTWQHWIRGMPAKLLSPAATLLRNLCRLHKLQSTSAPLGSSHSAVHQDHEVSTLACAQCGADISSIRWPAYSEAHRALCDSCGESLVVLLEAGAVKWLVEQVSESPQLPEVEGDTTKRGSVVMEDTLPHTTNGCDPMPDAKRQRRLDISSDSNGTGPSMDMSFKEQNLDRRTLLRCEEFWWFNHLGDLLSFSAEEQQRARDVLRTNEDEYIDDPGAIMQLTAESRLVCAAIEEIDPLSKPVKMRSVLIGLDSLRIARLANLLKIRLGRALTVPQLREAKTVSDLCAIVSRADQADPAESNTGRENFEDASREYAVWYSPGQYRPMGYWILRSEGVIDRKALLTATQQLVDRHAALRVHIADPMRYNSFLYDAGTLFTLYSPLLDAAAAPLRVLRRCMSWGLVHAWPRVICKSRIESYEHLHPETAAPLEILEMQRGQTEFERDLRQRRERCHPPGAVTGFELVCYLEDVWKFDRFNGRFVIAKCPAELVSKMNGAKLVYIDTASKEYGPLIVPGGELWQHPPFGFPTLFFVPLNSGAVLWLRLEQRDELRICYKYAATDSERATSYKAFRAAPQRSREIHEPTRISFLAVSIYHAFADGNCYLPLVHDLLNFYDAARGNVMPVLPQIRNPFADLERRLFDTFLCRASPLRTSIRGGIFRYDQLGYSHDVGIEPNMVDILTLAAAHYRIPFDVALLGLVVCAQARVEASDHLEYTLYAPMRDGLSDAMAVGLFSDWRDLSVSCDMDFSTILGTLLHINYKIQHRQWSVFNALRKPERTVVNIQPLDFQPCAGFHQLGENMWRDGDQLAHPPKRPGEMDYAKQPANFVIEQQDEGTWWILCSAADSVRPPQWMRGFVFAFRQAIRCFIFDPLSLVHRPMPDDAVLLQEFAAKANAHYSRNKYKSSSEAA